MATILNVDVYEMLAHVWEYKYQMDFYSHIFVSDITCDIADYVPYRFMR